MRPGSIVECISNKGVRIANPLKIGGIYQVRDCFKGLCPEGSPFLVRLEEVYNDINPFTGNEVGYMPCNFRELLPPEAMQKEINELLEEPVLL